MLRKMIINIYLIFIIIFIINENNLYVNAKGRLVEDNSVIFENCSVHNLRNIREYHTQPQHILVQHCTLNEIPNALFIRFSHLEILEITDSRLTNIQDFAFNGLKKLQTLSLLRNNLTAVKSWSDHELGALLSLDLRRNLIRELAKDAFEKYPNLTRLNLAVNLIEEIPEGTFKSNPHLKYLNLGKNLIKTISDYTFKGLHKLNHLFLHHNKISLIDFFGFVSTTHLKSLRLDFNHISALEPEMMSNLPRLSNFNLSHNGIEHFIDATFKKNIELKILDISWNKLVEFNELSFKGLEAIEIFNASHNYIEFIHKFIFEEFTNLKFLDLSSNNITSIPDDLFEFTRHIEAMNFSNNRINEINDDTFKSLNKLQYLDLAKNQLEHDNFIDPANNLLLLNLSSNNYHSMNISKLYGLEEVRLYKNPFDCKWLLIHLSENDSRLILGQNYIVESIRALLNVTGVDCLDETGNLRSIIVLDSPQMKSSNYEVFQTNSHITHRTLPTHRNSEEDSFDTKSAILWLGIGILAVFGGTKACRILLSKSEKKTEDWRQSQQDPYIEDDLELDSCSADNKLTLK